MKSRFLSSLLVWLALLGVVVGMPLHEAGHLADAAQALTSPATSPHGDDAPAEPGAAYAGCVWCLTHADTLPLPPTVAVQRLPAVESSATFERLPAVHWRSRERWPFAARDPPANLS